jgi:glutaredoxin 3
MELQQVAPQRKEFTQLDTTTNASTNLVNSLVSVWGKDNCPRCEKAKHLLAKHDISYNYYKLGKDFEREELLECAPNAKEFPQIFVNDYNIGGYTELEKLLNG